MPHIFTTSGKLLSALILFACLVANAHANPFSKENIGAISDAVKAVTVTDADLKDASAQMMAEMDKKNKVASVKDKYGKRLVNLTKGLANEDGLQLNFKVYMSDEVNAFATPDGSIRVFSGLMDIMNDDELRFIIGHEIGHAKLGHSLNRTRTAYMASAAAKMAKSSKMEAKTLVDLGEKFVNAQYSQSNEFEADAYGVEFMKRNKYNLPAAESAMRKLAEMDQGSGGASSIFSTHPDSKTRADRIKAQSK
ncbi:MAG: M48 family metalloprotease [Betaproteobacteria bacterium]|nr:M48 family metalloprotease [Betaproteobacteria bacterium]